MPQLPSNAQWFQPYPKCPCGRPSAGQLYSDRNSKLGDHCQRCADKAIKDSHKKGRFLPDSPLEMADQAKDFRRLSDKDRDELLWWMIMHANVALQQQGGAPTEAFNDIERRIRGDA